MIKFKKGDNVCVYNDEHEFIGVGQVVGISTYLTRIMFQDGYVSDYKTDNVYPYPWETKGGKK